MLYAFLLSVALVAVTPAQTPALGYPVTVNRQDEQCRFLIQDMWMSDSAMVERWLAALPDKSVPIDLWWGEEEDQGCIDAARKAAEQAGFRSIIARRGKPHGVDPAPATAPER